MTVKCSACWNLSRSTFTTGQAFSWAATTKYRKSLILIKSMQSRNGTVIQSAINFTSMGSTPMDANGGFSYFSQGGHRSINCTSKRKKAVFIRDSSFALRQPWSSAGVFQADLHGGDQLKPLPLSRSYSGIFTRPERTVAYPNLDIAVVLVVAAFFRLMMPKVLRFSYWTRSL